MTQPKLLLVSLTNNLRMSSIRLLVRFTESSFGYVANDPGWSFFAVGEGEGGLVDDNVTSIQAHSRRSQSCSW